MTDTTRRPRKRHRHPPRDRCAPAKAKSSGHCLGCASRADQAARARPSGRYRPQHSKRCRRRSQKKAVRPRAPARSAPGRPPRTTTGVRRSARRGNGRCRPHWNQATRVTRRPRDGWPSPRSRAAGCPRVAANSCAGPGWSRPGWAPACRAAKSPSPKRRAPDSNNRRGPSRRGSLANRPDRPPRQSRLKPM